MRPRLTALAAIPLVMVTLWPALAPAFDAAGLRRLAVAHADATFAPSAITDDGGAAFAATYARLGGSDVVGYPVSERFVWNGFVSQVMQKAVFQWRPERNGVAFVNVLDELHNSGKDDWLAAFRSTPRPLDSSFDAGKSSGQIVRDRLALLDANPAMRAQYWAAGSYIDPVLLYGLPASRVVDNGNHYAIRLQRAVIQQWKVDVQWAKAGQTTVANGGDIAKESGIAPLGASAAAGATPTFAQQPLAQMSAAQPFTGVPNHASESFEGKGAVQWLPQIKFAVRDAVRAGLLRSDEVPLWVNVLLGAIGLESVGRNYSLAGSGAWVSQGLLQLVPAHLYPSENPFDPLTNIRVGLRTIVRYYRMWGNRWDRAVAQHLTGRTDEAAQRDSRDWAGTSGMDYVKRVVNGAWAAQNALNTGNSYPPSYMPYQQQGNGGFDRAPSWSIFASPNLSFNWQPPSTSQAAQYQSRGADNSIQQPINRNLWVPAPDWFYSNEVGPNVPAYNPPS